MTESGAKKKILEIVERLPDDATIEDAIERLYFFTRSRMACGRLSTRLLATSAPSFLQPFCDERDQR